MKLQGERLIPATVERTWAALNDPETLKACIAGCESIETTGENAYLALMAVRIGPVNAKFKGRLQLDDIVPLTSYTIRFDGQGGVAGFGKGSADVRLAPDGDGAATRLTYAATAQVGGKIAQVGSRLVEAAAGKIADDFFKAFEARMTDAGTIQDVGAAETGIATAAETAAEAETAIATAARDSATVRGGPEAAAAVTNGVVAPAGPAAAAPGTNTAWLWIAAAIVVVVAVFLLAR